MSETEMPEHLQPELKHDGPHIIATFGNQHYVFEESGGVLNYLYTEDASGETCADKPRKNVLAYLNDLGYSVPGFESYY